jgi:methionyl-tRNA formyltransferase
MINHSNSNLKIAIFTTGVTPIVEPLLKSQHKVVGIIEAAPRNYSSNKKSWFELICQSLKNKIDTICHKNLYGLSIKKRIPYFFYKKNSDNDLINWLEKVKPNIIVVHSICWILKPKIFEWPQYKTINLHPSYLPDYRGPIPQFWYRYYMDLNPGATIHYIDAGEDTGDIIVREKCQVPLGINYDDFMNKIVGDLGCKLLIQALDKIDSDKVETIKQPQISPTIRARKLKQEEHSSLIDWNTWDVQRVFHLLRGTANYLSIMPKLPKLLHKSIWSVEKFDNDCSDSYKPGSFIKASSKREWYIICKNGKILVKANITIKQFCLNALNSIYNKIFQN